MKLFKPSPSASILALFTLIFAGFGTAAHAEDLWFHITVEDRGNQDANVSINLPLSVIEMAIPMIPSHGLHGTHIEIDDAEFSMEDLRNIWRELENSPDSTFVTVDDGDDHVRVWKEDGYVKVRVTEENAKPTNVDVKIPTAVIDALLSGEGGNLNIAGALRALADHGEGELVAVDDEDATVRMWIDSSAAGR